MPHNLILQRIASGSVIALHAAALLLVIGLVGLWPKIKQELLMSTRALRVGLCVVVAAILLIAGFVAPRNARILFDEYIYQQVGQVIATKGRAVSCNNCKVARGELQILAEEKNKEPDGYPYLLSWFYRLFGLSEWVGFIVNTVMSAIACLAIFFIGKSLRSEMVGLAAAAVYALTPMVGIWSATSAAEPSTAAMACLAMYAAILVTQTLSFSTLAFFLGSLTWAVQMRPESALLIMAILVVMILPPTVYHDSEVSLSRIFTQRMRELRFIWLDKSKQKMIIYFLLALGVLLAPHFAHLWMNRENQWGSSGPKFSIAYLASNFRPNVMYWFANERFPLLYTAFAAIGFSSGFGRVGRLVGALWFLPFFAIFLFFYAGSYDYGADVRFAVLLAPSVALMAGFGVERFLSPGWIKLKIFNDFLARLGHMPKLSRSMVVAVLAILAVGYAPFLPLVRSEGNEGWDARSDVEFVHEALDKIPRDAVVVTHVPSLWNILGRNAMQVSIARDNQYYFEESAANEYGGDVYLHWGYWCGGTQPIQSQLCTDLLARYPAELIAEKHVRTRVFKLFKFSGLGEAVPNRSEDR